MRTPGPMTALAQITVSMPISAPGPTTTPGSSTTPLSSRADACTVAPGATPSAAYSEDGRNACGKRVRATVTKAR